MIDEIKWRIDRFADPIIAKLSEDQITYHNRKTKFRSFLWNKDAAVGRSREFLGQLQFAFLLDKALKPYERFLDIGCGNLRAGKYLIPYLDPCMYHGVDISHDLINDAYSRIPQSVREDKQPSLYHREDFGMGIAGKFDRILSHSLATHLPKPKLEELIYVISKKLDEDGIAYITYWEGKDREPPLSYGYHRTEISSIAQKHNLAGVHYQYDHPLGQSMIGLWHDRSR